MSVVCSRLQSRHSHTKRRMTRCDDGHNGSTSYCTNDDRESEFKATNECEWSACSVLPVDRTRQGRGEKGCT